METVTRLVAANPVVIFSKSSCCMSHSMISLIRSYGANVTEFDIDNSPNGAQIDRALVQLGCQPSVPAVFIGNQLIGGANQVMSFHVQGQLEELLIKAKAIFIRRRN